MYTGLKKNTCILLAILLLFIFTQNVFAAGQEEISEELSEVTIGNLLPLSGALANDGDIQKRGFDLAIEEINASGGIKSLDGAKIKMIYADSRGEPQVGMTEIERLITVEKVHMLTGAFQSSVTLPTSSVAEKYGIPYYVPNATTDAITEQGFKYTFRTQSKSSWLTRDTVSFLADMGVSTVAMAYEDTENGQAWAKGVRKWIMEKGLNLVLDEAYPHAAADLTPLIAKAKNRNPDAFIANSYSQDAILIAKTMNELGFKPKWKIGLGGVVDPMFIAQEDLKLGWCATLGWYSDMNNPHVARFVSDFEAKYDSTAAPHAALGYAGAYVMKEVFEQAASTDPEKLREAFANLRIDDPNHRAHSYYYKNHLIYFDENGQCPTTGFIMGQYFKGPGIQSLRAIWPQEMATDEPLTLTP